MNDVCGPSSPLCVCGCVDVGVPARVEMVLVVIVIGRLHAYGASAMPAGVNF